MNADRLLEIINHFYKHPHLSKEEQEMIDDLIELDNEIEQLKEVMRKYDKYANVSFAKKAGIDL